MSEGFVSDPRSKSPSQKAVIYPGNPLDATPQSAFYQETSRSNLNQENAQENQEGYYLSMGDMIAQHQQSKVEDAYGD